MNTSQYMDKQIMDLALSGSGQTTQGKDFIGLMKHPEEEHQSGRNVGGEIDELRAEEIVPSYDFQPIRPVSTGISSPKSLSLDGGSSTRAWSSVDNRTDINAHIRNYSSLDSFKPAKVIIAKDQHGSHASIVSEIDQTMKKHIDNVLHALDTVSARLTQLESRTRNLENSVDDLKLAAETNHGNMDGKMTLLENILREVQNKVLVIKDKHEVMEGQLQLTKLPISKPDQLQESYNFAQADPIQLPPLSLSQQSHIHPPPPHPPSSVPFQQSIPSVPPATALPPPPPQQVLPPSVPIPNYFPQLPNPSVPPPEPYFQPSPGQPQEASNQPYQLPPSHQPLPPPAQQHQHYPPPQQPRYAQPTHTPQQPPQLQATPRHHPEEPPYMQYPPPGHHQPPLAQPQHSGAPPSQQLYGSPPHIYEPPPSRPSLGYSSDPYPYGGSQQRSQSNSGGGYPQLPTARILPRALPTASGINSGPGSDGTGNRVPIDDVVDKVTSMDFPRDQVRATVQKLTENGQSVDLNVVLDKLMNDSDFQPPRGWLGR
ncbi:hypothetical protein SAY87_021479 [Trapa incisa]|uniref:DUF1421 domain-containing protein n=1 Tax=Trapa incisa TaxID=236973 RepID=A0AAN7JS44_9MYRT|nr:hypothetical protein SAY87_021479 [Trapa incisa]